MFKIDFIPYRIYLYLKTSRKSEFTTRLQQVLERVPMPNFDKWGINDEGKPQKEQCALHLTLGTMLTKINLKKAFAEIPDEKRRETIHQTLKQQIHQSLQQNSNDIQALFTAIEKLPLEIDDEEKYVITDNGYLAIKFKLKPEYSHLWEKCRDSLKDFKSANAGRTQIKLLHLSVAKLKDDTLKLFQQKNPITLEKLHTQAENFFTEFNKFYVPYYNTALSPFNRFRISYLDEATEHDQKLPCAKQPGRWLATRK